MPDRNRFPRLPAIALLASLVALALLAPAMPAARANAQIAPVLLDVGADGRGVVRITNLRDAPVLYRIRPLSWRIVDGSDRYGETADFIASPPSFMLRPKETRTVRVGFRNARRSPAERAYRLVVEEVPARAGPAQHSAISLVFSYMIPVFVAPDAEPQARLSWSVSRSRDRVTVRVVNRGNRHAVVNALGFAAAGDAPRYGTFERKYVLAGSVREWTFAVPAGAPLGGLLARTENRRQFGKVAVGQ